MLNTAQDGFTISDNATPVGDLFKINDFANTVSYLKVAPLEVVVPDGVYAQFQNYSAGTPGATDCDSDTERGRQFIDTSNNRLYICNGAARGWDYAALTD